jgi:hypothetical protein
MVTARALGVGFALAMLVSPVTGEGQSYDGRYTGFISCDAIPGQTVQQLKTEFAMTVASGQAEYQREVLRPTGPGRLGVTERGTGPVSPTGEVSLTGAAGAQTWNYEATYTGRIDGRGLRLSGTQLWHLPNRAPHSRPCTVAVTRIE